MQVADGTQSWSLCKPSRYGQPIFRQLACVCVCISCKANVKHYPAEQAPDIDGQIDRLDVPKCEKVSSGAVSEKLTFVLKSPRGALRNTIAPGVTWNSYRQINPEIFQALTEQYHLFFLENTHVDTSQKARGTSWARLKAHIPSGGHNPKRRRVRSR